MRNKLNNKKLNTFTLSGLIIGPILGSGVILLPPLIYNMVGNYSLFVWLTILVLGFAFALIFGKLAILFPGEAGVSLATREAMGKKYQQLTAFYLILAVFFGPVAVLLIAGDFIQSYFPNTDLVFLAFGIYVITYALLLVKIDFLGKIMLVVSSTVAIIFLVSSIYVLVQTETFSFVLPQIDVEKIGYSFLLIFWSIVGWEVIGNYSNEVKDSETLKKAVVFSAVSVSIIYALISLAVCFGEFPLKDVEPFKLVWLLEPIFGVYANIILVTMSLILCIGTLILFVGGVARLIFALSEKKSNFITKKTSINFKNGTPIGALNALSFIYMITLYLVYIEFLSLDNLVAFADGFFIANAIIGLVTAIMLFEKSFLRYSAFVLAFLFTCILLFSNIYILITIVVLFIYTYLKKSIM
ncbi:MAG TPA: amino acid permease [Sulfurospirillum arcachonense]|nr:amino acid permease [Sulfurospirillum arcachonense]